MSATADNQIRTLIQQIAGTFNKDIVSIISCTVDKQNTDYTIDCTPISGDAATQIPGVKLNADNNDGFIIMPKVGSTVIVATSTRNNYYVFMYSDIDKIINIIDNNNSYEFSSNGFIWNDGLLGGMVKVYDLLTKINQLEAFENAVIAAVGTINAAALSSPTTPVTNATLASFLSTISPVVIAPTILSEIEDTKIKH